LNKSFEQIFQQFYSPLCNYATKIIRDDIISEDIVQQLFIQLWENGKLETADNPERYLLRATKFKCIDYLRSKKNRNISLPEELPDLIQTENSELLEEDIEPLLHYYASKLPPKTREVFLLSRNSGLTYKQIAEEMDVSIKTVENQMGRALRKMRELLKEQEYFVFIIFLNFI